MEGTEQKQEAAPPEQEAQQEEYVVSEEVAEQNMEQNNQKNSRLNNHGEDRSSFIHGLAVGLGIGCIATFIIMWIAVFFTPLMPTVSYESLLAVFIYPLLYLLAVGLVALTAGIVREYYSRRPRY
jgi:threonine/homoserine/homoserine lactone efflux protein